MDFNNREGAMSMRMGRVFALSVLLSARAFGQVDYIVRNPSDTNWNADTLYLGSSFARINPAANVVVSLKTNDAAFVGQLFLIHPSTGAEIFLFQNQNNGVNLTSIDITAFVATAPLGTPITFMYRTVDCQGYLTAAQCAQYGDKKYSGRNLPNLTPAAVLSSETSDNHSEPDKRFGRRWCVVGRVAANGSLEFGFEDLNTTAGTYYCDMDFNDIIFRVTGLVRGITSRSLASKGFVW